MSIPNTRITIPDELWAVWDRRMNALRRHEHLNDYPEPIVTFTSETEALAYCVGRLKPILGTAWSADRFMPVRVKTGSTADRADAAV